MMLWAVHTSHCADEANPAAAVSALEHSLPKSSPSQAYLLLEHNLAKLAPDTVAGLVAIAKRLAAFPYTTQPSNGSVDSASSDRDDGGDGDGDGGGGGGGDGDGGRSSGGGHGSHTDVVATLLIALCRVRMNAAALIGYSKTRSGNLEQRTVALGVFHSISQLNHSYVPLPPHTHPTRPTTN